jgi:hypothetical protein
MTETAFSGHLFSQVECEHPQQAGVVDSATRASAARWSDPEMARRQEDEAFRAMRVVAYLLLLYFAAQALGFLFGNDDGFANPYFAVVSMATVAVLAGLLFALDARHRQMRRDHADRSSRGLILFAIGGLVSASLIQMHLTGSMNSFHLLLVLAILLVVSWMLEVRDIVLFFVISNVVLAAIIALEYRGVLTYAPLFSHHTGLGRFFLDWRIVAGTIVNYVFVLAAAAFLTMRLRGAFRRHGEEQRALIARLNESLSRIHTLESLLPICASCKKVRNDQGGWDEVEEYLLRNANIQFTHSYCPTCADKMMDEIDKQRK